MSLMKNFNSKTVYTIGYSELEAIIKKTFGFTEYSILAAEDCSNDSVISIDVADNGEDIEGITSDSSLSDILDEMCTKDLIISGSYLIDISY